MLSRWRRHFGGRNATVSTGFYAGSLLKVEVFFVRSRHIDSAFLTVLE